jgi:serine/threonine protein kinase
MNLMKHDRIVEFIGATLYLNALDLDTETFSIILELLPIVILSDGIRNRTLLLSWVTRRQILRDICEGGAFLHSSLYGDGSIKRIVLHQDIKSANILLSKEDGVLRGKIADFGLSFLKEIVGL